MTDDLPPAVRRDLYDDAVRLNSFAVPAVWVAYVAGQSRLFEQALVAASAVLA